MAHVTYGLRESIVVALEMLFQYSPEDTEKS
jgi:hypothetical protein